MAEGSMIHHFNALMSLKPFFARGRNFVLKRASQSLGYYAVAVLIAVERLNLLFVDISKVFSST